MKYTLKDYWEANSSDERQKIVEWAFKQLSDKIKYCQCHSVDLINIDLSVGLCRDCGKPPIWDIRQETEQPSPISDESLSRMLGRIELGIDENEKPVFLSGRELKEIISIVNKWMKTKHTKEHWKYILGVDFMTKKKVIYIGNDCGNFAELRELPNHNFQQMKAKAKLIAAAPELLEACKIALTKIPVSITDTTNWKSIIEQAIKKATN